MTPTRALPEWIGKSPDSTVPPRVRDRVFTRYDGRCQCGCNREIRPGESWDAEDTLEFGLRMQSAEVTAHGNIRLEFDGGVVLVLASEPVTREIAACN